MLDETLAKSAAVWVAAPGGAGKTTLALGYLQQRRRHCLWYQLDEGDADPASFFYHFGRAAQAVIGADAPPLPLLTPEYQAGMAVFARNFFRRVFQQLPLPCTVVLDNYQTLAEAAPLHDLIAVAVEELLPGVTLMVLSRGLPPPSFARLQANQELLLIEPSQLVLTAEEIAGIAALHSQRPLAAETLRRLQRLTAGWAAGVVLVLQRPGEPACQEDLPDSAQEAIFAYFASEVLRHLSAPRRELLLRTALLPEVRPAIAEALSGNPDAAQILAELHRRNFFVTRLGKGDPVYRYHPLFHAFLLEQARATLGREAFRNLQKQAAELLVANGEAEAAVFLLLDGRHWGAAGELIVSLAGGLLEQGRYRTLLSWIRALPEDRRDADPWLCYWLGQASLAFDIPAARAALEQAWRGFQGRDDARGLYLSLAAILNSFFLQWDDFSEVPRWVERLDVVQARFPLADYPDLEPIVVNGLFMPLAFAFPADGRLPALERRMDELVLRAAGGTGAMSPPAILALYWAWRGEGDRLCGLLPLLEASSRRDGVMTHIQNVLAHAEVTWMMGHPAQAESLMKEGLAEAEGSGMHLMDTVLWGQACYAALAAGDAGAMRQALARMHEGLQRGRRLDAAHHQYLSGMLALLEGEPARALQQVRAAMETARRLSCNIPVVSSRIATAQALTLQGRHEEALEELAPAEAYARRMRSDLFESMAGLVRAWALLGLARREEALASLRRALAQGRRHGLPGPFAWTPGLSSLLALALRHDIETDYVTRLIKLMDLLPADEGVPEAWPFPVRIHVLGRFGIFRDGRPIGPASKASRKPLELLRLLIVLGGSAVSEAQLMEDLWPDADGDMAHQNLKATIHRLRKLIGHQALVVNEGRLSFDRRRVWVDLWCLEAELERLNRVEAPAPGDVRYLLELYPGPLLPDCELPGVIAAREALRSRFLRVVQRLADRLAAAGQMEAAVAAWEKALEVEPCAEELYQGLMRCYLRQGLNAAGLNVYARCVRLLAAGPGVAPCAETERLREALRRVGGIPGKPLPR